MRSFIPIVLVAISGCAAPGAWYRGGSTEQEFNAEKFQCLQGAQQAAPPAMVSVGGAPGVATTNCHGYGANVTCTTNPGVPLAPVTYDANDGMRMEAFRACMRGKGWQWRTR